jgi:hypothetical protein
VAVLAKIRLSTSTLIHIHWLHIYHVTYVYTTTRRSQSQTHRKHLSYLKLHSLIYSVSSANDKPVTSTKSQNTQQAPWIPSLNEFDDSMYMHTSVSANTNQVLNEEACQWRAAFDPQKEHRMEPLMDLQKAADLHSEPTKAPQKDLD